MNISYYNFLVTEKAEFCLTKTNEFSGYRTKLKEAFDNLHECRQDEVNIDVVFCSDSQYFQKDKIGHLSTCLNNFHNNAMRNPCIIVSAKSNTNIEYSLFDNTNIWIRHINQESQKKEIAQQIQAAVKYFSQCNVLKLYDQNSAKEYIDYHLRIQKDNHLNKTHKNIVPNRYSSEVLINEKDMERKQEARKAIFVENIGIRLLLIDDKIPCLKNVKSLKLCKDYEHKDCNDTDYKDCKLRIVRDLLKNNSRFCGFEPIWNNKEENINAYTIGIESNIKDIPKNTTEDKVQIIGVNTIDFAKTIMADSSIKFDLILLDYYFHERGEDGKEQTNYGVELLTFIEKEHKNSDEEQRQKIRRNAGLENRFWIFSITAFAPSFLNHLQCEGISLLTNKWYIYSPTNPIVTPIRFLRNLNEFIGIMVDRSVYIEKVLLDFFKNSYKEDSLDTTEHYISFMGAEYQRFMQLYGSRLTIARDENVSLFASSIRSKFYKESRNGHLISLNYYMRKFYYASAFLVKERQGWEQLRKTWDMLSQYLTEYFPIKERDTVDKFNTKVPELIKKMIDNHKT